MNRGKLLFAFVLPCAASASGCAPSAPARARTTVLGAAPATRRDASVVDSGVVQARAPSVTLYALGSVQCVFGPNRERLFIAGGFRARVDGGVAQLATESLADSISNVAHTAHGYVFVSSSGAVVRSNEFIGALTRMPDLPNAVAYRGFSLSLGRLAVTLAAPVGGVFVTDGRSAFERVDALAGVDAAAAKFIDAQHGLVLGIDRELVTTRDGVRWELINTRGHDFDSIAISEDRRRWNLVEYGTLRSFVMEPDGPIQPSRGPEPADDECRTTMAEAEAVWRAIRARYPSVDDATVAGELPTQRTIRLEHPVSHAPVELPGYNCTRQGTRARVWVKCTLPRVDDRPLGVVAVAEAPAESGQYRTVAAIDPASAIQFLDDGESAIWISDDRPADGDAGAGASTLVVASGAGAIRRWPLSRGGYGIRGVTNGHAVLAALRGPAPSVAIVDTRSGAITEHRVSPSQENVEVRGTVSVDGTALVRFGAAYSESREVFVIARGESPRTITLPTGAREAAMFDRERGVAASGTGGLWVTSNGGSSWTDLAVPVDGVRTPFGREETIDVARCSSRGCLVVYSRLLAHLSVTWGTQRASSTSPLAIDRRTAPRPARSPALLPRLRCETVRSTAAEPPPSSRAPASATRTTLFGTGTAVLSTWTDRGRTMVELSWRGVDGAVAYEAASAPTPMDTAWARGTWSTPHLATVSPRGALLVLCPESDSMATTERPAPPRCQYRLAPTAAAIQRIDGRRTFHAAGSGFATISEDGHIWTWGVSGIGDIRALDARGARLAGAWLSQPLEPLWRGILREGASSRAVVSAPSSLTMLNTGDLNGRPTPFDRQHMAIDPPSVCRSPVAANARRMIVSESGARVNGAAFTDIVVRLAESSDGFCVERVDSAAFPSLTSSTSSTLLAQPDGSLDGTRAIEGGTREVLHCTLAAP